MSVSRISVTRLGERVERRAVCRTAGSRFYPYVNATPMAKRHSGKPARMCAFDSDAGLVIGSVSGGRGISTLHADTAVLEAPDKMPSWEHYRPPAFASRFWLRSGTWLCNGFPEPTLRESAQHRILAREWLGLRSYGRRVSQDSSPIASEQSI